MGIKALCGLVLVVVLSALAVNGCSTEAGPDPLHATPTSQIIDDASAYDGKVIEISGQTFAVTSPPKVVVDGRGGMNLTGKVADLGTGFYALKGTYEAATNTLDVSGSTAFTPDYISIESGSSLGLDLVPVSLQGLIATVPKDVADQLRSYLSFPYCPEDLPIYPYTVFNRDGLYLVLSDHYETMPTDLTYTYEGETHHFYFSAGEVKGTLVQTPLDSIDFGSKWTSSEFGGVVIAESIGASEPLSSTVAQVVNLPGDYAFKRVKIDGSYLVATATIDYADFKLPFGVGLLADTSADFFREDAPRLKTIDPGQKVWQLRDGEVIGTVLYPTEEVLNFLDYSAPLTKSELVDAVKPILVVDTLVETVQAATISEVTSNPSQYWGKVVELEGYGLGFNLSVKAVATAIAKTEIPVDVNFLAFAASESYTPPPQLAIIGLNTQPLESPAETILGKYKFKLAVTQVPEELVTGLPVPIPDTAYFLLSKEELEITVPSFELHSLTVSATPSESGRVALSPPGGMYLSGTSVQLVAAPGPGYVFDYWSGDASGTSPATSVTMDSDKTVVAHFKQITYTLTVTVDPLGTGAVTVVPPTGPYVAGLPVELTAVPAPLYKFS
ncbi:MAG: hypothetical protein QUS33_01215, partial [Dehalococcoidia bacterium]|nr:hypothetical protein [Dehalococcoidia bacterium]